MQAHIGFVCKGSNPGLKLAVPDFPKIGARLDEEEIIRLMPSQRAMQTPLETKPAGSKWQYHATWKVMKS